MSNNTKGEVVVFGDDMWNTYGVIRSLGESGTRVSFINVCRHRSFAKHSKYIKKYWQVDTEQQGMEVLKQNFVASPHKTVVFCTTDEGTSYLDMHYDELKDKFITYNSGGIQGRVSQLMSKETMLDLAGQAGLDVPSTISLDLSKIPTVDELQKMDIVYPCLTKADSSIDGSKENLCKCDNATALLKAINAAKKRGCHRLQIQQYIEKEYEMMITGCADGKGNVILPGIIKKIVEWPMGFTALASIDPDIEKYINPELVRNFVRKTSFCGVFSIEFLLCKGKMFFIEMNLRNDGNGYASIPGGVNIHDIWLSWMRGEAPQLQQERVDRCYTYQIEPNSLNYHHYEAQGYRSFLKEFFATDFKMICNIKDPLPGLYRFALNKVLNRVSPS